MTNNLEGVSASEQFITLFNSVHGRLLGFLRTLLANQADAEDVLQRASMTIWRKFEEFDRERDFFTWASRFVFYEAKNFQRVSSRSKLHFDSELMERLAEERILDLEHRDMRLAAMDKCIEELDGSGRELICASYLDNTGLAVLADRLKKAQQTLYNKLNILRRMLGDCVTLRLTEEA